MNTFLEDIAYVWLYIIFIFQLIKMASCAIPCPKPIHLPPTLFTFLEERALLVKMLKNTRSD